VAFAERYPFLLVDEFQDTDPLQAEIMLLLTADDQEATDWQTAKVKPGSLFVVGDPQQSIYRFRRADIEVFEFVKDRIVKSGGRELFLTTNFRTNGPLVGWVNAQFSGRFAQWRKDHGPCVPEFKPSTSGRSTGSAGMLSGFRQLRIQGTNVAAEAEAVASFIRRAIDNRLTVPRTEKETSRGIAPECRPEDFMIVTGDTGKLSTYANALHAVGLPCDVTGRKGPDSEDDLRTLRLCLKAITDPDDAVAALAALRSPVFGFSDAELYAFRAAGGKIRGWLQVPPSLPAELRERYEAAAEALRRWIKMAGSLPLPAAVEAIADQAGLLLIASAADGQAGRRGRAGAGAIMTFIERVRAERHLLNSVQDVVARIDESPQGEGTRGPCRLSLRHGWIGRCPRPVMARLACAGRRARGPPHHHAVSQRLPDGAAGSRHAVGLGHARGARAQPSSRREPPQAVCGRNPPRLLSDSVRVHEEGRHSERRLARPCTGCHNFR
jgi:ATP-dependent helicase/nuclease subunit A